MKKTLLVLALLGAVTTTHAQSSVTLQGTVDVGLAYSKGSLTSRKGLISGGNATSKLIFRGVEDLGGGLYAMFWLESGLNADDGTGQPTNINNQPTGATASGLMTFNRRSIVGLGGSWGEMHLGRDWSPSYETFVSKFDPFALAVGLGINYSGSINPNQIRASNTISYLTPKVLGGFGLNVQHWFGENTSGTPTERNGTGSGVRLTYDSGPINAAATFMQTSYATGDAIYRNIAGAYDFEVARLSFNVNHDQQGQLKQSGWLVGLTVPVGVTLLKASYSTIRTKQTGQDPEGRKLAIGAVYNLSKRTALYSTIATIRNSGGARYATVNATTAPNRSSTGIDLGIRHNF
ncbi:porin [Variovorax sp. WS11]|uniref:porin n=1 Tax=Variovorax sp. WS11 TaxID=1105204 RepID=UPI000D0D46F8|nr:porin [Variovorax sp. WS11]NDZ11859.1 porin [Variovorax sp. WS11]PSL79187.1 porin [Variovorax sp. WS11]